MILHLLCLLESRGHLLYLVLKLHEVRHAEIGVAVFLYTVDNHGNLAAIAVRHYLHAAPEGLLHRVGGGVVTRLALRGISLRELATALEGEDADALSVLAVALEVESLPHLLTGAAKSLHQEGLGLIVCQYLLFH